MFLKRNKFLSLLPMIMGLLLISLITSAEAQTLDLNISKVKFDGSNITVSSKDIEEGKAKAKEVKTIVDTSIHEIESFLLNLQRDIEATNDCLEKLQQDKKTNHEGELPPKISELLNIELSTIKGKIDVDNELIESYKNQIAALQNQSKAYSDYVELLESIIKMPDVIAATPFDQIPMLRQEADVAKGYIATAHASLKERDTIVSFFTQELTDVKARIFSGEQDFSQYLESLRAGTDGAALSNMVQEKITNTLLWKKTIGAQWITIFATRLETAKARYDHGRQVLKNAELNAAVLDEKVYCLEEKFKREELKKKQADLEAAKKVAEINQKIAETNREKVEKTLQDAIKRSEKIALEQVTTTSPEKKRVLELEAEVHKQEVLLARQKDELITEGTQRYKDVAEYKELETNIELFLSKGSASKEIDEMYKRLDADGQRFSDAKTAVESLIASLTQEEKLFSDNLDAARKDIAKIRNEVAAFGDEELARQAVEFANKKADMQKEQLTLISTRLERLHERLEIKKDALNLLQDTKENLIKIRAANIWTRIESTISMRTVKDVYTDLTDYHNWFKSFYENVLIYTKNILSYISDKRYTIAFWLKVSGLAILIAGFYFSRRFIHAWCASKIEGSCVSTHIKDGSDLFDVEEDDASQSEKFGETDALSYYKTRLLPSLFIVLKKSFSAFVVAVLFFSLAAIFHIEVPWLRATMYVLTFFAVYKVLNGFLIESFSPEKGDKKLVTSLAYISPKHIYKPLNIILLFSFISLSVITVLTVFHYKSDVIEFLWFVYRLVILVLLLWLATQKTLLFKLLPSAESQLGRFIYRIITIIYPVFIVFVVSLFAIRNLGYPVLTYVLLKTCIESFIIAFVAFWIWKYLSHRLNSLRKARFRKCNIKTGTPEEENFLTVTKFYYILCNYAVSIITGIVIIKVWVKAFYDALSSPAAPYLIQKVFGQVLFFLVIIGKGLRYRFLFEDGRHTTPTKIILGFAVLFISFFIARYIKNLLEKRVFNKLRMERGSQQTLSTVIRYFIIGIAALIGLNLAGIPLRSLTIFAGAFGIGIGFGMQNIISNFVSGIILLFERPMRVGDVVTLEDGTLGTIERINARSTTLVTPDEVTVTVPNSKFIENRVTNWTLPTARMRGNIKVGVVYGSDVNLVKKSLLEAAKQVSYIRAYPECFVRFASFGDNALVFELYYWADDPGKRWHAQSELNFAIDAIFRKNNIEIAFPLRNIHIRSIGPFPVQNIQESAKDDAYQDINYKRANV